MRPGRCSRTRIRRSRWTCSTGCRRRGASSVSASRPTPEDQVRFPRLREDRAAAGFPFLRERRRGSRPRPRDADRSVRRGRLRVRGAGRPAPRDPRGGPSGLMAGDGFRRLVQRPSRLPGALLRPLRRARRRRRERERRRRRGADARADGGARSSRPIRRTRRSLQSSAPGSGRSSCSAGAARRRPRSRRRSCRS